MEVIRDYLAHVKVGKKQTHLNMTLFPLLAPDNGDPDYVTLDEALEREQIEVTEVSESGSVPDLRLINRGKQKVLIIEGEELQGAKQNRIVNLTFLIDCNCELVIPVSCVEQGRWSYRSERFSSGKEFMPASIKREHQQAVRASLSKGEGFRSNQSTIWEEISAKGERLQAESSTGAMADIFHKEETRLSDFVRAFRLVDCQVGAVFGINGKIVGAECFGYNDTCSSFFDRLVRSYALDAIDWIDEGTPLSVSTDKGRSFLESVGKTKPETRDSLGLGQDIRIESATVSGVAMSFDGLLLHLSAFKKEKGRNSRGSDYQRFSARRDRRVY